MPQSASDTMQLPLEIWAAIAEDLRSQQADASLAALAQTSSEMYDITILRLYDTVRIRNPHSLQAFITSMNITFHPVAESEVPASDTPAAIGRPDRRSLIHHFEITGYPFTTGDPTAIPAGSTDYLMRYYGNNIPLKAPVGFDAFPNVETCYVTTKSQDIRFPKAIDAHTMFICLVLTTFPSKFLRWQHMGKVSHLDPQSQQLVSKASIYWSRYRSTVDPPSSPRAIQLPSAWQNSHMEDMRNHAIYRYFHAHSMANIRPISLSAAWYTNSRRNEQTGMEYARLKTKKATLRDKFVKPTHVIQLIPSTVMPPSQIKWRDQDMWRAVAGTITDFAVMAKQDLINVQVVSLPEDQSPEEWKQWLKTDAFVEGGDVSADLRAILARIEPGVTRRPYEEVLDYQCVKDLLATVEMFIKVAFKGHGLSLDT